MLHAYLWGADMISSVNEEERAEVIALCEDPEADLNDVGGRPPTPGEVSFVNALADSMFFQRPIDKQIEDILHFPTRVSARRLAQMSTGERDRLLSHVPKELAQEIISLLSGRVA